MSVNDLTSALPEGLLTKMELRGGSASWPLAHIPAVIEACRASSLINRGGDLQILQPDSYWESPNIGIWVFESELNEADPQGRADQAAGIALAKLFSIDDETLLAEAVTGCPYFLGSVSRFDPSLLRWTWRAEPAGR